MPEPKEPDPYRMSEFALTTGRMMGFLRSPDVVDFLNSKRVTNAEISDAYDGLLKVAEAFYR